MPLFDGNGWYLAIIVLALPTQYLLTRYFSSGSTSAERDETLQKLLSSIKTFPERFFSFEKWKHWFELVLTTLQDITGISNLRSDPVYGETYAKEVHRRMGRSVDLFGFSNKIRSSRSKEIAYRVGQVVKHRTFQFRGVIVGWDRSAKAPEDWLKKHYPEDVREVLRKSPAYRILVDRRDRDETSSIAYVPQEHLDAIGNKKIYHPELDDYFDTYDGAQYLPRPWLRKIYPED